MEKRINKFIQKYYSHLPESYHSGYSSLRRKLPIDKKVEISQFRRSIRKKLMNEDQTCSMQAKSCIEDAFEKSLEEELNAIIAQENFIENELETIKKEAEKYRKNLSGTPLFQIIYVFFRDIQDMRGPDVEIPLEDALMSAFSMFALKFPSLLQFDKKMRDRLEQANLKRVFGVGNVPSDTQMRSILDPIDPKELKKIFKVIFHQLQRGKVLEEFVFLDDAYLLATDGTGIFSSKEVHCKNCMEKHHRDGSITYYHQILGAVLLHPDRSNVIPVAPEPILKQDGDTKNDCERNAMKRFLEGFRKDHPKLKVILTEDGLSSNGPHIRDIKDANMSFILGAKKSDHQYLFNWVEELEKVRKEERDPSWSTINYHQEEEIIGEKSLKSITHKFRFANEVPLNDRNNDLMVNFLEYWEVKNFINKDGEKYTKTQHFSWVTDIELTKNNVYKIMRGGRARWKIENETFNTLKTQGYHFEHNFGHGDKNLSTNFAQLMMLAFLVDQTQELACPLFKKAMMAAYARADFWKTLLSLYRNFAFTSWSELLSAVEAKLDDRFTAVFRIDLRTDSG